MWIGVKQNKTKRTNIIRTIIVVGWFLSIGTGGSLLLNDKLLNLKNDDITFECLSIAVPSKDNATIGTMTLVSVLLINCVLYAIVLRTLVMKKRLLNTKRNLVAKTKLMIIVYVVFFICWAPGLCVHIIFVSQPYKVYLLCVSVCDEQD